MPRLSDRRIVTYGMSPQADVRAENVETAPGRARFDVRFSGRAAGADGLSVEGHPNPEMAVSDGDQSLRFEEFDSLMAGLAPFAVAAGRTLAVAPGAG